MLKYTERIWNITCALLLIAGGVWFAWREREMARFKERSRAESLLADSLQAARDSTRSRAVVLKLSAVSESVRVYQRRIVQARQHADSLDEALGTERAARYSGTCQRV